MSISENVICIRDRIRSTCIRSERDCEDVTLVAVTKTVDTGRIKEAVDCGISILGENRVQEIINKYPHIQGNVEWHMIGHLQTNKVKYITDKVSMIHSVDSLRLLQEIDKRFKEAGRAIDVLIEVNIGREENKYGIDPGNVIGFLNEVSIYENARVRGLMTVAPAFDDTEKVRPYFKQMKVIFEEVRACKIQNIDMKFLSMGMTNDFEVAIEEGANIVRIGSGIFGPRNY